MQANSFKPEMVIIRCLGCIETGFGYCKNTHAQNTAMKSAIKRHKLVPLFDKEGLIQVGGRLLLQQETCHQPSYHNTQARMCECSLGVLL